MTNESRYCPRHGDEGVTHIRLRGPFLRTGPRKSCSVSRERTPSCQRELQVPVLERGAGGTWAPVWAAADPTTVQELLAPVRGDQWDQQGGAVPRPNVLAAPRSLDQNSCTCIING